MSFSQPPGYPPDPYGQRPPTPYRAPAPLPSPAPLPLAQGSAVPPIEGVSNQDLGVRISVHRATFAVLTRYSGLMLSFALGGAGALAKAVTQAAQRMELGLDSLALGALGLVIAGLPIWLFTRVSSERVDVYEHGFLYVRGSARGRVHAAEIRNAELTLVQVGRMHQRRLEVTLTSGAKLTFEGLEDEETLCRRLVGLAVTSPRGPQAPADWRPPTSAQLAPGRASTVRMP